MVRRFLARSRPELVSGDEALSIVGYFAELSKLAGSGTALYSPKVTETGSYAKEGHASAPDWLAAVSGSSAGVAKSQLAAAERAATVPELTDALRQGSLSAPQLGLLTDAAGADPEAVPTLLEMLEGHASHQEVSDKAKEMKAAARIKESEHARRARVHAGRSFRWHQVEGGGVRGEFFCDEVAWARVGPRLESATRARFKAAGAECEDSYEAHRLDALIDLLGSSGRTDATARPRVMVIVDAEALKRGTTSTGEICEIEGIGPVPVESAVELLGEASLEFIVKEGRDVRTVTKASRDIAQKTLSALFVRDRTCVVPGCGKRLGLQADHCYRDYADDGPSELENLALLCPAHHDMKTHGGWKLSRHDDAWQWIPPARPPDAGRIGRARRLAAAKAKGRSEATRNTPRRT
jgi:hypothetical protein